MALGPDWSSWSQSYTEPGDRVTSPSLRSYMQIQATLISNVRSSAASLSRISVQLHDPIAQALGAELWPVFLNDPEQLAVLQFHQGKANDVLAETQYLLRTPGLAPIAGDLQQQLLSGRSRFRFPVMSQQHSVLFIQKIVGDRVGQRASDQSVSGTKYVSDRSLSGQ